MAQNENRDSLLKVLATSSGNKRVDQLNALGKSLSKLYRPTALDSAELFASSAIRLAINGNYKQGEAEANRIMALTHLKQFKRKEEIKPYLDRALFQFASTGNNEGLANTHNNMGSMWTYLHNLPASIASYDTSLILYQRLGDKKGEAAVLNYIGIDYQKTGDFIKAIDYTLKGLEIRKQTNDFEGTMFSYLNVGNIFLAGGQTEKAIAYYKEGISFARSKNFEPAPMAFNRLGEAYLQDRQYKEASKYLLKDDEHKISYPVENILVGKLYYEMNNLDSAEKYFQNSLLQSDKYGDKNHKAQALTGLSKILFKNGNTTRSKELAVQAIELAEKDGFKLIRAEASGILSEIYEKSGQPERALFFFKIEHAIQDSLTNGNYQNKLAFFESRTEIEKREARIGVLTVQKELQEKLVKQERQTKYIISFLAAAGLMVAFFVVRNINRKRERIQLQKAQIEEQKITVERAFDKLKSAQAQLIQSEKMASLGELAAGIAHEIQNPLNFVNNFSEVNRELLVEMKEELVKGNMEEANSIANDVIDNEEKISLHGKRADAIVKGMLQHSKAGAGNEEPSDINAMAAEYLRLSYNGLRAKDKSFSCALKTDFDPSIGKVNIIPQDIGRVLLNLFNNAFYAVAEMKKIKDILPQDANGYEPVVGVSSRKSNGKVEIKVTDNGNGIPEKMLDKIFQPFFTTKPTGQGTGLGLSLSYDIIKAHSGELTVESKEGAGSVFIFTLPV